MSSQNARLIVLVTSMLAFTIICVTVILGLRLHRARGTLLELKQHNDCSSPLGRGSSPR